MNKRFSENLRNVYRYLKENKIEITRPPDKDELEEFWIPLFENKKKNIPKTRG